MDSFLIGQTLLVLLLFVAGCKQPNEKNGWLTEDEIKSLEEMPDETWDYIYMEIGGPNHIFVSFHDQSLTDKIAKDGLKPMDEFIPQVVPFLAKIKRVDIFINSSHVNKSTIESLGELQNINRMWAEKQSKLHDDNYFRSFVKNGPFRSVNIS